VPDENFEGIMWSAWKTDNISHKTFTD